MSSESDSNGNPAQYESQQTDYECSRCHCPAWINPVTGNAEHVESADAVACAIFSGKF